MWEERETFERGVRSWADGVVDSKRSLCAAGAFSMIEMYHIRRCQCNEQWNPNCVSNHMGRACSGLHLLGAIWAPFTLKGPKSLHIGTKESPCGHFMTATRHLIARRDRLHLQKRSLGFRKYGKTEESTHFYKIGWVWLPQRNLPQWRITQGEAALAVATTQ